MASARKIGISATVAVFVLACGVLVALASTLPHEYDCTEFDFLQGGAGCSAGTITLVGGSSAVISGFYANADPNILNGGSDVYVTYTASGSGTGKMFSQSYPGQVQGSFIDFSAGTATITIPQPSTGDTNSGLVVYANSSFSGTITDICVGTTNPPVCSSPPPDDTTATTTPDAYPGIFFNGFLILMFGIFTPILMGRYIDNHGK